MKDSIFVGRGLIIDCMPGQKMSIQKTSTPPEELMRPGLSPQTQHGKIKDVLFIGGNESKQNYLYNIEDDQWIKSGILPKFHIVTAQINVLYKELQTITVYVQADFNANKFKICAATNNGNLKAESEEWKWIFDETVDIENFHIKSAIIINETLVIFARGRPRNVLEQCCSFMLNFKLRVEKGLVVGFNPAYNYIKLDPNVYPQYMNTPFVSRRDNDMILLAMVQENNFNDAFPRQTIQITIPDSGCFVKDCSLINTNFQQLVDMEFPTE